MHPTQKAPSLQGSDGQLPTSRADTGIMILYVKTDPRNLCAADLLRKIGLTSTDGAELALLEDNSNVSQDDDKESESGNEFLAIPKIKSIVKAPAENLPDPLGKSKLLSRCSYPLPHDLNSILRIHEHDYGILITNTIPENTGS